MSDRYEGLWIPEYKSNDDALRKARESVFIIEDESPEHKAKREAREAKKAQQKAEREKKRQEQEAQRAKADKDKALLIEDMLMQQYNAAKNMVSQSLDNKLNEAVDKIRKECNISDEAAEQIRNTIRAHKNVRLNQQALIVLTEEKAATEINKAVRHQIDKFYDTHAGHVMKAVNKTTDDVLGFCQSLEKYAKMDTPDAMASSITKQLDHALASSEGMLSKVGDKLNSKLQSIGLGGIDCNQIIGPMIKNFDTKGAGAKLASKLQPFIKKNIKVIQKVAKVVQKINAAIQKFQKTINNMVAKATAALTEALAGAAGQAVAGLASNIKINF